MPSKKKLQRKKASTYLSKNWAKALAATDKGWYFEQEKFLAQIEESEREEENKSFTLADRKFLKG